LTELLTTRPGLDWYLSPQDESGDFADAIPLRTTNKNRGS